MSKFLNIEESAKYLGLSIYTIRKKTRSKEIPHYFLGGKYLYKVDDLDEWVRESRVWTRSTAM